MSLSLLFDVSLECFKHLLKQALGVISREALSGVISSSRLWPSYRLIDCTLVTSAPPLPQLVTAPITARCCRST